VTAAPGAGAVVAGTVALLLVGGSTTGCVAMTPLQDRAWHAFQDCQRVARTAQLRQVTPDGRLGFEAEDGDMVQMKTCLRDRWGYPFAN
jgi:hypothetical protein